MVDCLRVLDLGCMKALGVSGFTGVRAFLCIWAPHIESCRAWYFGSADKPSCFSLGSLDKRIWGFRV